MILQLGRRPSRLETETHWMIALALAVAFALQTPLMAQGLDSEETIDAIVGSDVKTEETKANAATERLVAAINASNTNAERVRKTFSLEGLDIVFLPDLDEKSGAIATAMADHERDIEALREAVEGSALFYHAVDSRSIMTRDIVALEYAEGGAVTIFVKGEPNGG
ncbi:hypothetical protein [Nitratireductor sp. ZSWI3]|uniref:hypothetical protein n=1 Tax=Nitratireductor sp. ZSWI3 TaxID=2966359 RepID=UPI002150055E|nr:hypothetical protein [Nitratireductor sp. ZSWI3]MCR4266970.1 hypothetical protein [Nitratireductor sp. ZSWI3]